MEVEYNSPINLFLSHDGFLVSDNGNLVTVAGSPTASVLAEIDAEPQEASVSYEWQKERMTEWQKFNIKQVLWIVIEKKSENILQIV